MARGAVKNSTFERNAALRSGDGSYNLRDMSFIRLTLLSLAACMVWTGCPPGDRKVDEEKDSWYLMGVTRQSSMDYEGAVEQFQKALEANPHSASAHKKLGILYEKELEAPDYAAAIHHYQRLLALRPDDQHADIIRRLQRRERRREIEHHHRVRPRTGE